MAVDLVDFDTFLELPLEASESSVNNTPIKGSCMKKRCPSSSIPHFLETRAWFIASCVLLVFTCLGNAQDQPDTKLTETKSEVISQILEQLQSKYVFPEVAADMERAIRSHVANRDYATITSGRQFAEKLQSDLRAISRDQHLELAYSYEPIPIQDPAKQEKIDPEREARIRYKGGLVNYWFKNADVLPGNVGYLRFDGFFPLQDGGRDTAESAMAFLQHTSALIIDLRASVPRRMFLVHGQCAQEFSIPILQMHDRELVSRGGYEDHKVPVPALRRNHHPPSGAQYLRLLAAPPTIAASRNEDR